MRRGIKHIAHAVFGITTGLMIGGTAHADMEIFGNLHMSVDSVGGAAGDGNSVSSNQSILALRGTEELSNGLEAIWQVAQIISIDQDRSPKLGGFATFNSGVGLRGDWGTVFGGRHDMPFKFFLFPMFRGEGTGPFIIRHLGDTMTIMGTGLQRPRPGGLPPLPPSVPYNLRASNLVMYTTPAIMKNVRFRAAYSTDIGIEFLAPAIPPTIPPSPSPGVDNNDRDAYSFDLTYMDGPLYLGVAYENHESIDNSDGWRIGGSYRIDRTKFGGFFEILNGDPVLSPDLDRNAWTAWISQGFGENSLRLFYSQAESYSGSKDTGADLWTIQLAHNLSFTTEIYALYTSLSNEANSTRKLGQWGHGDQYSPARPGDDLNGYSIGIVHRF